MRKTRKLPGASAAVSGTALSGVFLILMIIVGFGAYYAGSNLNPVTHTSTSTVPTTSSVIFTAFSTATSVSTVTTTSVSSVSVPGQVIVFATGLNNPRGITFGPDGDLYVAEGGTGGSMSTIGMCEQAQGPPAGVAPYTGDYTASISKISMNGTRTIVAGNLPSTQWSPAFGGLIQGVSDVQFLNGVLYGLTAGGGCSHGFLHTPNMIFRVNSDGSYTMIANLSAFLHTHPVAIPDNGTGTGDFEPDGTWYGMVAAGNSFYATEPNSQQIVQVSLNGTITRLIDLSTRFVSPLGWAGDTGIAYHNGTLFFGQLGYFCCPGLTTGNQSVYSVSLQGVVTLYKTGFTAIVGVEFDSQGRLYVLESTTTTSGSGAGTGAVVRVGSDGKIQTIVSGLTFPTGMAFGPDGNLYVSNYGYGAASGGGQILRVIIGS